VLHYSPSHWRGDALRTVIHWALFLGYGAMATVYLAARFGEMHERDRSRFWMKARPRESVCYRSARTAFLRGLGQRHFIHYQTDPQELQRLPFRTISIL